jgi:outer membrane protein TolC
MIKKFFLFGMISLNLATTAQNEVLDGYVREGLANNLALRQKTLSAQRAMAALREARGMFLPSVSIEARYSRAGGGRIIDIPIGDLMNPVYYTLNQLIQQPLFPTNLPNESIPFLREEEQETKLRITQPLFHPAILFNYRIKSDLKDVEDLSRAVYARQLVLDIRTAYFNFLKADKLVELLSATETLVREHVRVVEKLHANDKANLSDLYRAQAEIPAIEQQKAEAEKGRMLAASYLNFLLNRPLDGPIEKTADRPRIVSEPELDEADSSALARREELRQMDLAISLMKNKVRISAASFLPGITAVLDWGYWDEKYRITPDNDYWMASLVASWNLFNGFQDKYKVDQAKLEKKEKEAERLSIRNQILLQIREARENVKIADAAIETAERRLAAARKSFDAVDSRYRQGLAPQIELIEGRNNLTLAEVGAVAALYDYQIRKAEWEKATASFPLSLPE